MSEGDEIREGAVGVVEATVTHRRSVLCVEDSRMFSDLLGVALGLQEDLAVAGQVGDVAAALDLLARSPVDVVVMDCGLPGTDGVEGVRLVKHASPSTRVVLLTAYPTLEVLVRAASAGADAFLAKDSSLEEILAAIRSRTHDLEIGGGTLDALRLRVRGEGRSEGRAWDPHLTERERDVLALLAEGLDPQTIAGQLGITVHTSRSYVRNVLAKLGAHSQLEAVIVAARSGIVRGLCTCDQERDDIVDLRAG